MLLVGPCFWFILQLPLWLKPGHDCGSFGWRKGHNGVLHKQIGVERLISELFVGQWAGVMLCQPGCNGFTLVGAAILHNKKPIYMLRAPKLAFCTIAISRIEHRGSAVKLTN